MIEWLLLNTKRAIFSFIKLHFDEMTMTSIKQHTLLNL